MFVFARAEFTTVVVLHFKRFTASDCKGRLFNGSAEKIIKGETSAWKGRVFTV